MQKPWIFDILCVLIPFALFLLNEAFIKNAAADTPLFWFVGGYLNDVLVGFAFAAFTNLIVDMTAPKKRIQGLLLVVIYIAACGVAWEFVAPVFFEGSVADVLDVLSYVVGGVFYWAANKTAISCFAISQV